MTSNDIAPPLSKVDRDLSTQRECLFLFRQHIRNSLRFWLNNAVLHKVDVAFLDRKRESILKTISIGLEVGINVADTWSLVRPLIIAFASYMERPGHWEVWHSLLQRAMIVAEKRADLDGKITLTALLARLCQHQNRVVEITRYYRWVIQLARQTGNPFEEARARSNMGFCILIEDVGDAQKCWAVMRWIFLRSWIVTMGGHIPTIIWGYSTRDRVVGKRQKDICIPHVIFGGSAKTTTVYYSG